MTVLAIAMHKGGVGKTTTTLGLGVELARMGARTLLIDRDPQSNVTIGLGYDPTALDRSVYDVLLNPAHGIAFATLTTPHGADLPPATLALAGAELMPAGRFGRELLLRTALQDARRLNPGLAISGVVVTMVDRRTTVNAVIEEAIRQQYGEIVFRTVIPFNVRLIESPAASQPISVYAANSSGARAYRELAQEVATRYGRP